MRLYSFYFQVPSSKFLEERKRAEGGERWDNVDPVVYVGCRSRGPRISINEEAR